MLSATGIVLEAGRHGPLATAVVAAGAPSALAGAKRASEGGLIEPVLVGDPDAIRAAARALDWDISGLRVVAASDGGAATAAVSLARGGEVGALMKGHLHTDALLRAVLDRVSGLRRGRRLTHVFHMSLGSLFPPLLITDAAVNVAPDQAALRDITLNAIDLAHALGAAVPRVALLSATEEPSDAMPSSRRAAELAAELAGATTGRAEIAGPLALDNAVSAAAAELKGIAGPVAGRADVLVVPGIETGNALFKALVHFAGATAAGVVLGAAVPIMLTSRADPPEARLVSAALARLAMARA